MKGFRMLLFFIYFSSYSCPSCAPPPLCRPPSPPLPHTTHWPSRSSNDLRFPFPPSDLYVIVYMSLASPSTLPPYTCLRHNQTCTLAATSGPFFLHQGHGAPPPPPPSPPQSSKRHPRIMIKATCGDEIIGCYGLFCVIIPKSTYSCRLHHYVVKSYSSEACRVRLIWQVCFVQSS